MSNRDSSLEMGSERRGSLLQTTGFGAYTNGMAFAGMGQQRNPLANPNLINRSQEQGRLTSPAGQGMGCELGQGHDSAID
jgi:CCR4-NOT transcription complex subunit 2